MAEDEAGVFSQIKDIFFYVMEKVFRVDGWRFWYFGLIYALLINWYIIVGFIASPYWINGTNYQGLLGKHRGFCLIRYDAGNLAADKPIAFTEKTQDQVDDYFFKFDREGKSQYFYDFRVVSVDGNLDNVHVENDVPEREFMLKSNMIYLFDFTIMLIYIPFYVVYIFLERINIFFDNAILENSRSLITTIFILIITFYVIVLNLLKYLFFQENSLRQAFANIIYALFSVILVYFILEYLSIKDFIYQVMLFQAKIALPYLNENASIIDIPREMLNSINGYLNFFLHYDTMIGVLSVGVWYCIFSMLIIFFSSIIFTHLLDINLYYVTSIIFGYVALLLFPIVLLISVILPINLNPWISLLIEYVLVVPMIIFGYAAMSNILINFVHYALPLAICYVGFFFNSWYINEMLAYKLWLATLGVGLMTFILPLISNKIQTIYADIFSVRGGVESFLSIQTLWSFGASVKQFGQKVKDHSMNIYKNLNNKSEEPKRDDVTPENNTLTSDKNNIIRDQNIDQSPVDQNIAKKNEINRDESKLKDIDSEIKINLEDLKDTDSKDQINDEEIDREDQINDEEIDREDQISDDDTDEEDLDSMDDLSSEIGREDQISDDDTDEEDLDSMDDLSNEIGRDDESDSEELDDADNDKNNIGRSDQNL